MYYVLSDLLVHYWFALNLYAWNICIGMSVCWYLVFSSILWIFLFIRSIYKICLYHVSVNMLWDFTYIICICIFICICLMSGYIQWALDFCLYIYVCMYIAMWGLTCPGFICMCACICVSVCLAVYLIFFFNILKLSVSSCWDWDWKDNCYVIWSLPTFCDVLSSLSCSSMYRILSLFTHTYICHTFVLRCHIK